MEDQIMPIKRLDSEALWRRGGDLYENHIRPAVETEENIGKLINIDVETGDYEIDIDRNSVAMTDRLLAKHPDAQIIQLRIGYRTVHSFRGVRMMPSKRL